MIKENFALEVQGGVAVGAILCAQPPKGNTNFAVVLGCPVKTAQRYEKAPAVLAMLVMFTVKFTIALLEPSIAV